MFYTASNYFNKQMKKTAMRGPTPEEVREMRQRFYDSWPEIAEVMTRRRKEVIQWEQRMGSVGGVKND